MNRLPTASVVLFLSAFAAAITGCSSDSADEGATTTSAQKKAAPEKQVPGKLSPSIGVKFVGFDVVCQDGATFSAETDSGEKAENLAEQYCKGRKAVGGKAGVNTYNARFASTGDEKKPAPKKEVDFAPEKQKSEKCSLPGSCGQGIPPSLRSK